MSTTKVWNTHFFTKERQHVFQGNDSQKRTLQNHHPKKLVETDYWLVVSTHLGYLPQIGVKIKPLWNHHLVIQHLDLIVIFPQIFGEQMVIYPCVKSEKNQQLNKQQKHQSCIMDIIRNTLDLPPHSGCWLITTQDDMKHVYTPEI